MELMIGKPKDRYDVAIVGGGPAGLTAAIYARRYNLSAIVFTDIVGGLVTENPWIENYPGFKLISGQDLAKRMGDHAQSLGADVRLEKVSEIEKQGNEFAVKTEWGTEVKAKAVILATGLKRRMLNAKNERELVGKGVSYCATCDAAFFREKTVAVVGGGNSAAVAALLLSEFARKVYIIYRRDRFWRMEPVWVKKLEENGKIEPIFNETVVECRGKERLEGILLKSGKELKVDGLFVEIGFVPTVPFKQVGFQIETDERGFVKVDREMRTSVPGIFAAGDITTASNFFQQIVTATAEEAIAADSAYRFVLEKSDI